MDAGHRTYRGHEAHRPDAGQIRLYATASCPAVLKDEVSGRYVIIGERRDPDSAGICGRVGPNEVALEISAELLEGALSRGVVLRGGAGLLGRAQPGDLLYQRGRERRGVTTLQITIAIASIVSGLAGALYIGLWPMGQPM